MAEPSVTTPHHPAHNAPQSSPTLLPGSEVVVVPFREQQSEEMVVLTVGAPISRGREAEVYSCQHRLKEFAVRCAFPRSKWPPAREFYEAQLKKAQFGALIWANPQRYPHLLPTLGLSFHHRDFDLIVHVICNFLAPLFYHSVRDSPLYFIQNVLLRLIGIIFLTAHPKMMSLESLVFATSALSPSPASLPFYISLSKVLFQGLMELQDFKLVPDPVNFSDEFGVIPNLIQAQNAPHLQSLFVLHNDIKLNNLLWCSESRRIKICDFGGLMILKRATRMSGPVLKTPAFCAPEMLASEPWAFQSSDCAAVVNTILFLANNGCYTPGGFTMDAAFMFGISVDHPWIQMLQHIIVADAAERPTPAQILASPFWNTIDADHSIATYMDNIINRTTNPHYFVQGAVVPPQTVGFIPPNVFKDDNMLSIVHNIIYHGPAGFPAEEVKAKVAQVHVGGKGTIIGETQEQDMNLVHLARSLCEAVPHNRHGILAGSGVDRSLHHRVILSVMELMKCLPQKFSPSKAAPKRCKLLTILQRILQDEYDPSKRYLNPDGMELDGTVSTPLIKLLVELRLVTKSATAKKTPTSSGSLFGVIDS